MIFVKKWVKKVEKKKMSTKKQNILFLPYMETKTILDSLVLNQALLIEEEIKLKKLQEIQELFLKMQETVEEQNEETVNAPTEDLVDEKIEETVSESTQEKLSESAQQLTESQTDELAEENVEESVEDSTKPEPIDFLALEKAVIDNYDDQVKQINKLLGFQIYEKYQNYLQDFDFLSGYKGVLEERFVVKDLLSSKFFLKWSFFKKNFIAMKNSFNIKYILYMEDYLFFWHLQQVKPYQFRRLLKLRIRKWKFKKRKLRKLYVLKKIKKFMFFKKYKKRHYELFWNNIHFFIDKCLNRRKILAQKIPVSERILSQYNLEFFYKLNKTLKEDLIFTSLKNEKLRTRNMQKFTIYLRNFHQKPYWKLRKARITHWKLFCNKTIRKQRYKGFFQQFIKNYSKLSYSYTFFVNFFTKFHISWTRTNRLESFCKLILVEKKNRVVKLPVFFSNFFNWKILQKRNYVLKKKIGRWSFLNFKRSKFPWLQRKKNSPKSINHVQPNFQSLRHLSHWDVMTSYLHLDYELDNFMFPVVDDFKVNYHVKLHMYRYKSNK